MRHMSEIRLVHHSERSSAVGPMGLPICQLGQSSCCCGCWCPIGKGRTVSLLPRPLGVIRSFGMLWTEYDLLGNVFMSWWRIAQAFFWCAVVAIPLGILMSSYRWLFELINPVAAPMRAMPLTAFLPAFIALVWHRRNREDCFPVVRNVFLLAGSGRRRGESGRQRAAGNGLHSRSQNSGMLCGWCFARRSRRFSRHSESSMTSAGPT